MNGEWRPPAATERERARLPPLPRADRATVEYARGLPSLPGKVQRFKLFGQQQQWTRAKRDDEAEIRSQGAPDESGQKIESRAQSLGAMSRCSSRRSARNSEAPSTARLRAVSSKTLRAVRAVYQVEPVLDEGELRAASPASGTEGVEIGGQEAQDRHQLLLRQELREMRTGDDAVAYFTRHGANTELKLIHCVHRTTGSSRSHPDASASCESGPYDLLVIPEERIKREMEYFTITPSGVVHMMPGQPSECICLSEWVHQCMMYRVLKSMSFFRLYVHRKAMLQWRRNARDASFCRKRARLARGCFFTRPMLAAPMLRVKALTSKVGAQLMLSVPERCLRLDEFESIAACVNQPGEGMRQELERTHETLVEVLEALVASIREGVERIHLRRGGSSFAKSRTRSLAQEKLEAKERLRMEQILHEDEQAIGRCVRLADSMLQANLAQSATRTAQELYLRIAARYSTTEGSSKSTKKLFVVTAQLADEPGKVLVEPSAERLVKVFSQTYQDLLSLADAVPQLVSAQSLWPYRPNSGGQSVRRLLGTHRAWSIYVDSTLKQLSSQQAEATRLAVETYEPFRKIFEYQKTWHKATLAELSIDALCKEVERMEHFQELLQKFRAQRPVERAPALLLEGRQLRELLQPVPGLVLSCLWPLLQNAARAQSHHTTETLASCCQELDMRPETMSAFQAYARAVEMVDAEEPSLEATVQELQNAHRLMRRHGVRLWSEDQLLLERLLAQLDELSDSMVAAKGFLSRTRAEHFACEEVHMVGSLEVDKSNF